MICLEVFSLASLNNAAVVEDDDVVCPMDGGEPVCDHDCCTVLE